MSIQLGDLAPDFEADTTEGKIRFHEWLGNDWGVFFSHPKDFTPVCTTELGEVARIKPEFDRRGTKVIGLSVDPVTDHERWAADIEDTQGAVLNYPLVGDPDYGQAFRTKANRLPEPLKSEVAAFPRQALHARLLEFSHPDTHLTMRFEAPMPGDMEVLVGGFRNL